MSRTKATAPASAASLLAEGEIGSLARELASAYRQMAAFYRDQMELPAPEAEAKARGADDSETEAAEDHARIQEWPADQVSWWDLTRLADRDPSAAGAAWSRLKAEARNELASGHRTALALEWDGRPWGRAQFLAFRDGFRDSWPPQNAIEAALLDTAAHCFADYLECSEHYHRQASTEAEAQTAQLHRRGAWRPSHLSMAAAMEQSATMAERAHTRFLRTLKALHELRRSTPAVFVGTAGQVNVGTQQVNLSGESCAPDAGKRAVDAPG